MKHLFTAFRLSALIGIYVAAGCAHGANHDMAAAPGMYALSVDGETVAVPVTHTVFEALRVKASPQRLSGLGEALVVLDGMHVVDGLATLRGMTVCEVEAVRLLRPLEAAIQYGPAGGKGAVVVQTRLGRGSGVRAGC